MQNRKSGVAEMANGPDNLVLIQLREIRATLAEHSAQFAGINDRFAHFDKRLDEMRSLLGHTISQSTTAYLRSQEFDQRHELSEGETRSLRARVDDLERRITKVEEERDR
jgi:chromosome segregation ATPase